MGRFYNTSDSQYLDYVYREPQALMLKAVNLADQQIAKQEQAAGDLYGRLKFDALSPDRTRREEIIGGYKGEIDELARDIQANPLAYRKDLTRIRGLSDRILDDVERGEIGAIQGNFDTRVAYEKELDTNVKSKDIDADEKAKLLAFYDNAYGGANYESISDHNVYQTGFLAPKQDIIKRVNELGKGFGDDLIEKWGWSLRDKGDGKYIVTSKTGDRQISQEEIRAAMISALRSDPAIGSYLNTRVEHDIFSEDQAKQMLNDAVDFAMIKFEKNYHTESGTAKGDPFSLQLAGHNLKQKLSTPISRNVDHVAYPNLPGGAKGYEEAENYLLVTKDKQKKHKLSLLGDITDKIKAEFNIVPGKPIGYDPVGVAGISRLGEIDAAFEEANSTGDYTSAYKLLKGYGYDVDKKDFDKATEDMTSTVIADNNYNNLKQAIRGQAEKDFKLSNPEQYETLKSSGGLENLLDGFVKSVVDSPDYNITNTRILETQSTGVDDGTFSSKVQQAEWIEHTRILADSFLDFAGTGSQTGAKLLRLDGTVIPADLNTYIEQAFVQGKQGFKTAYKEDPVTGEQVKVYTGSFEGKPVVFETGKVLITHDPIPGMKDEFKYKQRLKFTDPSSGKAVVINQLVQGDQFPVDKKFDNIVNPAKAQDAKARNTIQRNIGVAKKLVDNKVINADDYRHTIPETNGAASLQVLGKGVTKFYDYRGNEITKDDVLGIIKVTQNK